MEREPESVATEHATFSKTLEMLKQEGSNILLVGRDTVGAHDAVCHRLLGRYGSDPRYRLFVTNEDCRSTLHGDDADTERARTIDYAAVDLSTPDSESAAGGPQLGALGIEIIEAINEVDDDAGGLESSELRLCMDSLVTLLQEHSSESVFRLLHMTTSRVDHVHGMGHYHLPLDRDHDAVNLFEPLFDAIVEVRSRNGTYEQRWELRDREPTTDWVPLDRSQ